MTVQLSQPDFNRLTRIVQNLPDFANVRDRIRLVAGALDKFTPNCVMAGITRSRARSLQ
ncbi:MAG: hypothetical protein RIE73_34860 [Coleofasciculus sp. C1-SOL-03]|uniref:hypothetical protein n=1 Tax=Coleofasciculus sp. C1-SOL-03 TaxID=3069522 RepID=UPI0032FB3856